MNKTTKDYKRRKKIGQFFTEEKLALKLLDICNIQLTDKRILEPSCGSGSFIKAVKTKCNNFKQIVGIDIDKNTLMALDGLDVRITLRNTDFLKYKPTESFDIIIGNPPFNLKAENFVDTTEAFTIKSLEFLKENGDLILILPSTVLRSQKYQNLRQYILQNSKICTIVDTSENDFWGADIETIALHLQKKRVTDQVYKYISKSEIKTINLELNSKFTFLTHNKSYYNNLVQRLPGRKLGDIFEIKRGHGTGLRGRDLDFFDDFYEYEAANENFIGIQNIAYRFTANVVAADEQNITDTITILQPKEQIDLQMERFIANFLNSSIAFYYLHVDALNNCRLTIHMDRYYIKDIIIPIPNQQDIQLLNFISDNNRKTAAISQKRNDYFYKLFHMSPNEISEVEKFWKEPKFKFKEFKYAIS